VRAARGRRDGRDADERERFPRGTVRDKHFVGAALLIAGVLWSGLAASPVWIGWAGAAVGVAMLIRR